MIAVVVLLLVFLSRQAVVSQAVESMVECSDASGMISATGTCVRIEKMCLGQTGGEHNDKEDLRSCYSTSSYNHSSPPHSECSPISAGLYMSCSSVSDPGLAAGCRPHTVTAVPLHQSNYEYAINVTWEYEEGGCNQLDNLQGVQIQYYDDATDGTPLKCYCVNVSNLSGQFSITGFYYPINSDIEMRKIEVSSYPKYTNDLIDPTIKSVTFEAPLNCYDSRLPPDLVHCGVPRYNVSTDISATASLIKSILTGNPQMSVNISWEPPLVSDQVYPDPEYYYLYMRDRDLSGTDCSLPDVYCFRVNNTQSVTVSPLNASLDYVVELRGYRQCSGFSGDDSNFYGCGHLASIAVTVGTSVSPTPTFTSTGATTRHHHPNLIPIAGSVIGFVILVALLALIAIVTFVILKIRRVKSRSLGMESAKYGIRNLYGYSQVSSPHLKKNPWIPSPVSDRPGSDGPSVLVVYSDKTPLEEIQVILQFLITDLRTIHGITATSHDFLMRGTLVFQIEDQIKRAAAVLCVCNKQFCADWNEERPPPVINAIKNLIGGEIHQGENLSKYAMVFMRQSDQRICVPTAYLNNSKMFLVTELEDIVRFIKNAPRYTAGPPIITMECELVEEHQGSRNVASSTTHTREDECGCGKKNDGFCTIPDCSCQLDRSRYYNSLMECKLAEEHQRPRKSSATHTREDECGCGKKNDGFCTIPDCSCQLDRSRCYNSLVLSKTYNSQSHHASSGTGSSTKSICNPRIVDAINCENISLPFIDPVEAIACDSREMTYHNPFHEIMVRIPEDAIPEGKSIKIKIGVMLHGPFQFPQDIRPVSPIVCLCVEQQPFFQFCKPVEVILPHYLHLTSEKECRSPQLSFMKASHNPNQHGRYEFHQVLGETVFQPHQHYATLFTHHFCFMCVTEKITRDSADRAEYCLIRIIPDPIPLSEPSWMAYFCVAFFLPTCVKAVQQQFHGYKIAYKIFTFSSDAKLEISFKRECGGGWLLGLESPTKITAGQVAFWDVDFQKLQLMHQLAMYPPRFAINVAALGATAKVCAHISFKGALEDPDLDTELLLQPIPKERTSQSPIAGSCDIRAYSHAKGSLSPSSSSSFASTISPSPDCSQPTKLPIDAWSSPPVQVLTQRYRYELRKKYPPPSLFCKPHLSDLMNEVAAKILHKWRCVGIQLGLGYNELTALTVSCRDDLDLCFSSVFTIWRDTKTKPYSWLTIIDCLRTPSVSEVRLAEKLTALLEDVESDETPL